MALAATKENFILHKLHSLTGIVPVGYYMVQHLALNSFTISSAGRFNAVIDFFEALPKGFLLGLEAIAIWAPLLFHAIYGIFITSRSKENYFGQTYGWSQNRMYTLQRVSGLFLFVFLLWHTSTTTGLKYLTGDARVIMYNAWQHKFLEMGFWGYALFAFYVLGVLTASYHLAYGIWNFAIRWGITISERSQNQVQRFSMGAFVVLTLLGWTALVGFLIHPKTVDKGAVPIAAPVQASLIR